MSLDVRIDRDKCMGSANCQFWAPGVFDLDEEGIAIALDPDAEPVEKLSGAADGCPTGAIAVYRDGERIA
jgi:ferredoxin